MAPLADAAALAADPVFPLDPSPPALRYLLAHEQSPQLSELTLGLLHKFNNVYTGIMFLTAECLSRAEANEPVAPRLREILTTLREAHTYVDRVAQLHLDEAEEDAGYYELDAVIATHLDLARLLLPRSTSLTHAPAPERIAFYASQRAFGQILLHAIGNAGEALPARDGAVAITSRPQADSADWIEVEIADNGPGFSEEVLARLFTPFCTTKEPSRHVGLGLVRCRELARKFGGELTAGNRPGGGAVVLLTLPRNNFQALA